MDIQASIEIHTESCCLYVHHCYFDMLIIPCQILATTPVPCCCSCRDAYGVYIISLQTHMHIEELSLGAHFVHHTFSYNSLESWTASLCRSCNWLRQLHGTFALELETLFIPPLKLSTGPWLEAWQKHDTAYIANELAQQAHFHTMQLRRHPMSSEWRTQLLLQVLNTRSPLKKWETFANCSIRIESRIKLMITQETSAFDINDTEKSKDSVYKPRRPFVIKQDYLVPGKGWSHLFIGFNLISHKWMALEDFACGDRSFPHRYLICTGTNCSGINPVTYWLMVRHVKKAI